MKGTFQETAFSDECHMLTNDPHRNEDGGITMDNILENAFWLALLTLNIYYFNNLICYKKKSAQNFIETLNSQIYID